MNKEIELDPRILVKNLEITRITTDHDNLLSNHVELQSHHDRLKNKVDELSKEIVRLTIKEDKLVNKFTDLEISGMLQDNQDTIHDLKETRAKRSMSKSKNDKELHFLLTEVHERMYPMMEYCERLTPVKLETDNPHTEDQYTFIVNITDEEEMMKTKLFRLVDKEEMTSYDDQTSRSILKDLRKTIKFLEK